MRYQHTQRSPAPFRVGILGFLVVVGVAVATAGSWPALAVVVVVVAIVTAAMAVFSRLTIEVTETEARASFGWGWPHRVVAFEDVEGVAAVRNRWLYGFGIRWFPGGTLWNVWGLDAVEFDLGDQRKLRFGTDDPDGLLAVVSDRTRAR